MANTRTRKIASKPTAAKAPKVDPAQKAPTKRQMATAEPRPVHEGSASATYRTGRTLKPLRTDYRCGQMSEKDNEFLRDVVKLGGTSGKFERRNIDAGRLGRLYTLGFVTYEDTGSADTKQIITVTDKAAAYLKPVKAA